MVTKDIKLESGKEYNLSQLFSGMNKIIIPDLQRDYCWGDKAWDKDGKLYKELVSNFVKNLLSSFSEKPQDMLTLGLIYGYENPKYHIQLCDGQQRITTLFLLLGIINRKTEINYFQKFLISDFELHKDDKEPYLQYAIRESTLYFLSDLVCNIFLNNNISIADIKNQDWYFDEYDLDASIQSMIAALHIIEDHLKDVNWLDFGNFIIHNLQLIYYDMNNRTRGEETFVIINTTGEPLTASENLKPILIGNIQDQELIKKKSNEWEDREDWFWQNRNDNESTGDQGLNEYYIWYWQIRLLQEKSWVKKKPQDLDPQELFLKIPKVDFENDENPEIERWEESIKLENIHSYFNALRNLVELGQNREIAKVLHTIQLGNISLSWFRKSNLEIVLPLIAYLEKFKEPKYFTDFVRRLRKNYFDKKWEERRSNYLDWRYIIKIIESSQEENVLDFETTKYENKEKFKIIANLPLVEWHNEEEAWKDILKKEHKDRVKYWEDHKDFMGDLRQLYQVANKSVDINQIDAFFETYNKILINNYSYSEDYDLQNLYQLTSLLENGSFDNRRVSGHWYCMLVKFEGKTFLQKGFIDVWRLFNSEGIDELNILFKEKLEKYFNLFEIIENKSDTNKIKPYDRIRLWALLEYLNTEFPIDYSNAIACFWNYPNLKMKDNNDSQLGNLLLGTSWFNNKTGWIQYQLPLMKKIHLSTNVNIEEKTSEYLEKIISFFNENQ